MVHAFAVARGAEGVALGHVAKAKLVELLAARLKDEHVFVGKVTIAGAVKETPPDVAGIPTIEPTAIADAFWMLFRTRGDNRVRVG